MYVDAILVSGFPQSLPQSSCDDQLPRISVLSFRSHLLDHTGVRFKIRSPQEGLGNINIGSGRLGSVVHGERIGEPLRTVFRALKRGPA